MKIVTVSLREQRVSPKKANLVMSYLRGKNAVSALQELKLMPQKSARLAAALLKSALDAAEKKGINSEELIIEEAICQEGRKFKRNFVRARGRATTYLKRMSHLKISLSKIEIDKSDKSEKPVKPETKENTKGAKGRKNGS